MPRLTPAQLEAMKLFNQLAASDALRLEANLEPGDIQLLNNHTQVRIKAAMSLHSAMSLPCTHHCAAALHDTLFCQTPH